MRCARGTFAGDKVDVVLTLCSGGKIVLAIPKTWDGVAYSGATL